MGEEIRRPEAGLSDAALSGVSGAGGGIDKTGACFTQATQICGACNAHGKHCSGERLDSLIQYLKEHGPYSVRSYRQHRTKKSSAKERKKQ